MTHLYRFASTVVFGIGLLAGQITPASAAPNIVVLIADDMGWADVGYHNSEIRTPELDRLAAEGVKLERFYAQAVCSPTRATLMTGRSTLTTGMLSPTDPWHSKGLSPDEKLLPEYFKEAGYQTHAVGKWHLGPNEMIYHPLNRGFDSYYGNLHGYMNYDTHTIAGRVDWQRDGKTVHEEGYSTRLVGEEAVGVVRARDPDKPLLLYVAFSAPHSPLQAPEQTIAEYADIDDEKRRVYAAMVTEIDRAIARITTTLEDEQIADNTLLMFFSDNGGVPALGANNKPLRGNKNTPFDGGIRVPALISWPGVLDSGSVFDQRITVMDLLPTFLAAADVPLHSPKPIEGQNLWPALAEGVSIPSQDVVLSHFQGGDLLHAYFKDEWKLVKARNADGEAQYFLFEILKDPYEQRDLAEVHPEVLDRLVAELQAIPRVEPVALNEKPPAFSAPGSPRSAIPDDRPPAATPYAESGPVPYPPGNYAEDDTNP